MIVPGPHAPPAQQCEGGTAAPYACPRRRYGNCFVELECYEPADCCSGLPSCQERLANKRVQLAEIQDGTADLKSERRGDRSNTYVSETERQLIIRRLRSEIVDLDRECGGRAQVSSYCLDECGVARPVGATRGRRWANQVRHYR